MAWIMVDDLTGETLDPKRAHRLSICVDGDELRGYDVAAGNPDDLIAALGEHLSGIAAPLYRASVTALAGDGVVVDTEIVDLGDQDAESMSEPLEDEPSDVQVAAGDRGHATDAVVRAWCTYWEVPCSKTGKLNQSARDAYERAGGGRPVDPTPYEDGARRPATEGHPAPAIVAIGDGSTPRRAEAVDPAGMDEAPLTSPPREPDALTRAEELLEQHWTPRQVADEVGLQLEEVRDLHRQLYGKGRR